VKIVSLPVNGFYHLLANLPVVTCWHLPDVTCWHLLVVIITMVVHWKLSVFRAVCG